MHGIVGAGDAGERVHEHKDVLAGLDDPAAALDHEAREAHMRLQLHVVRGRHDFGFHRPLEIGDFLGPLVNEEHHRVHFRMVRGDGVANLLEDGRLARARRRHDQPARALADGRDEVDDPGFHRVRRGLQLEFLDRVNRGQVLEAHGFGVILEGHFVDLVHGLELRAGAAMRRLRGPLDEAALAQKAAADGVRRHENIRGLGMEMVLRRAQKTKALLGDLQIAGTVVGIGRFGAIRLRIAHNECVGRRLKPFRKKVEK